jgi:phosphoribosyl 1,2-cyclic phosphodiesterase
MRVRVWGARGSVPAPGPEMVRYGGNTSSVQLLLDSGEQLLLDSGTGIRTLGLSLAASPRVNILLTHLHLDHIQGLMFFPPCFRSDAEIAIWGPASPEASLEDRIARYISAPLSPVEVRELPCSVSFRDTPPSRWRIGSATIVCEAVNHRGPTLARDADLLIHDCQYADEEYPDHIGWGHSGVSDALTFASRVGARRVLLFHHDPLHSDSFLDRLHGTARRRWEELGNDPALVEMAMEGGELEVAGTTLPAGVPA